MYIYFSMKKYTLLLAVIVALTLSDCGSGSTTNETTDSTAVQVDSAAVATDSTAVTTDTTAKAVEVQ